ncbi:hypothetical protein Tco_0550349 [Tanacetum coccineum]
MILELVEHGSLIWPTVEDNGVIRTKKYVELSAAKKIQADCDMKATNIILQGLPADIYSLEREFMEFESAQSNTTAKLPILKLGCHLDKEYERILIDMFLMVSSSNQDDDMDLNRLRVVLRDS